MSHKKPEGDRIGDVTPFGLRMHPDLRAEIESAARDNGRSMNSEIVERLKVSVSSPPVGPAVEAKISELLEMVQQQTETIQRLVRLSGAEVYSDIIARYHRSDSPAIPGGRRIV